MNHICDELVNVCLHQIQSVIPWALDLTEPVHHPYQLIFKYALLFSAPPAGHPLNHCTLLVIVSVVLLTLLNLLICLILTSLPRIIFLHVLIDLINLLLAGLSL